MPSTAIEAFSYDETLSELTIRYVGGASYVYEGVPPFLAEGLAASRSKGAFVNRRIKDRHRFHKVGSGEAAPAAGSGALPSLRDRLGRSLHGDE